ncbi:NAD(P)H-binding protein [Sciscionella marina]|uniref:NAD(P)H-binding protein n=1 Tax=Sciscionella marina TaxID=508770 RepID=UPI00037FC999|nr:NAD(P)H-binding protein [Sciscionella marina]
MTIAITGASGALGRATAELVLQAVDPSEVVLTTRHPDSLAEFAARGAGVRPVDFADPRTLATAFTGVDRLLLISTDAVGARLDQQRAAIAAAADSGVGHIAYTSVPEPVPANPALVVPDHAGTEQALRNSGVRWTMLRNNLYAHMQIPVIEQAIEAGRLVTNTGAGATAYVSREDCAAAAAAALTQDGHADKAYDITGPEALTAEDLTALASELGGREVELVHTEDAAYAAGLRAAGLPEEVAEVVTSFGAASRGGFLGNTSSAVSDLTGRTPAALADIIREALRS